LRFLTDLLYPCGECGGRPRADAPRYVIAAVILVVRRPRFDLLHFGGVVRQDEVKPVHPVELIDRHKLVAHIKCVRATVRRRGLVQRRQVDRVRLLHPKRAVRVWTIAHIVPVLY